MPTKFLLTLFVFQVLFPAFAGEDKSDCTESLERGLRDQVTKFASERDLIYPVSTKVGREHKFFKLESKPTDHILYIASGADIYRPLMNFPGVKNYHLFDALMGWGDSPYNFITELESRLKALPQSKVTKVSPGFTKLLTNKMLKQGWVKTFIKEFETKPGHVDILRKPLVYKVKFWVDDIGFTEKIFYLHFGDMAVDQHFKEFIDRIPKQERLIATFQTGVVGTPTSSSIAKLLQRGPTNGTVLIDFADLNEIVDADAISDLEGFMGPGYKYIIHEKEFKEDAAYKYSAWIGIQKL